MSQLTSSSTVEVQNSGPGRERPQARSATFWISGVLLLGLLALGIVPRLHNLREARAAVEDSPVTHPVVSVVHAQVGAPTADLVLPGNVEPLYTAAIYARTEGYLDRRLVDIGAKVKSDQLLAVISSPETDQQLLQARATVAQADAAIEQARAALKQAQANQELARLTKERDMPLGAEHAISQQIVDTAVQTYDARVADVSAANANILAAQANKAADEANVARLAQMKDFERVTAPFSGTIVARNVERGDLITTGSAGAGKPLFQIAQGETLRIQINVPQSQAVNLRDGDVASITLKERPGRTYVGKVVRSTAALDSSARTMLTEVQIDNREGSLLPGMYAQVKFTLSTLRPSLIIPTSSLIVDQKGMRVVTIRNGNSVHFAPVVIGRDMGTEVEVVSGITSTDALVANPSDLLNEGQRVEVR